MHEIFSAKLNFRYLDGILKKPFAFDALGLPLANVTTDVVTGKHIYTLGSSFRPSVPHIQFIELFCGTFK
jgi:hypothetical protein